ncbi:MAG TPA: hypothetical protein VN445_02015 [Rectinemataceae bacterium]|nr:hypothetical protein [Rectinemataceae bacterium]
MFLVRRPLLFTGIAFFCIMVKRFSCWRGKKLQKSVRYGKSENRVISRRVHFFVQPIVDTLSVGLAFALCHDFAKQLPTVDGGGFGNRRESLFKN